MRRMHQLRLLWWLPAAGLLALAPGAAADVIEMLDGRHFEGEIVATDATTVSIDAKVSSTIRTTLRLARDDIKSIERKPLPPGFFDAAPPPPQISEPAARATDGALYLEVPIEGEFGSDVFADGINRVIRYARRYRIRHLVFVIDSDVGDLDEVAAAYNLLRNNRRQLTYHALVRNCTGVGIAIPVWCDSIHMLPGAKIGGSERALSASGGAGDQEEEVLRAQIANDVVRQAGLRDAVAEIVRAMIVPRTKLAAWRDNAGEIVVGAEPLADLARDRLIFDVGPGELLVLDDRQAVELGLRPFDGGARDLGAALGYEDWKGESDYGRQAMDEALEQKQKEAADATAKYNARVEDNIRKRRMAEQFLEENLKRAAEWNPSNDSYEYYVRRWGWGWGGGRGRVRMTHQSRQRWQERSDTVIGYLQQAAKAVTTIEKLDREAVELGLEPTFTAQDLAWVKEDIQTKYNYFAANRNRRG